MACENHDAPAPAKRVFTVFRNPAAREEISITIGMPYEDSICLTPDETTRLYGAIEMIRRYANVTNIRVE